MSTLPSVKSQQFRSRFYSGFYGGWFHNETHVLPDGRVIIVTPEGYQVPAAMRDFIWVDTSEYRQQPFGIYEDTSVIDGYNEMGSYFAHWKDPDFTSDDSYWYSDSIDMALHVGVVTPEGTERVSADGLSRQFVVWNNYRDEHPQSYGNNLGSTFEGVWWKDRSFNIDHPWVPKAWRTFVHGGYLYIWNATTGHVNRYSTDTWDREHVAGAGRVWSNRDTPSLSGRVKNVDVLATGSLVGTGAYILPSSSMTVVGDSVYWWELQPHLEEESNFSQPATLMKMELSGNFPVTPVYQAPQDYDGDYAGLRLVDNYIPDSSSISVWGFSMCGDDDNNLWIGTSAWLYRYNTITEQMDMMIEGPKEWLGFNGGSSLWNFPNTTQNQWELDVQADGSILEGLDFGPSNHMAYMDGYIYAINWSGSVDYTHEWPYTNARSMIPRGRVDFDNGGDWPGTRLRVIRFKVSDLQVGTVIDRSNPPWETIAGGTAFDEQPGANSTGSLLWRYGKNPLFYGIRSIAADTTNKRIYFSCLWNPHVWGGYPEPGEDTPTNDLRQWHVMSGNYQNDSKHQFTMVGYLEEQLPLTEKIVFQFSGTALKNYPQEVSIPNKIVLEE